MFADGLRGVVGGGLLVTHTRPQAQALWKSFKQLELSSHAIPTAHVLVARRLDDGMGRKFADELPHLEGKRIAMIGRAGERGDPAVMPALHERIVVRGVKDPAATMRW